MYTLTVVLFSAVALAAAGDPRLTAARVGPVIIAGPGGVVRTPGAIAGIGGLGGLRGGLGGINAGVVPGAIIGGGALGGAGLARGGLGLGGLGLGLRGSGIEGQYVPDLNERLYDDGTYKPYSYGP
ncbi:hypothetical protein GWI33_019175 [Rhynchophorus ferrugineus]|uniref:Uncharacterized protein n=1 Tax=Rhynchophorus ferrugineus TaxID=354439 RepID=A0A834I612_RHYFE|nr:hypothetical protein GWI33_019175 [Rhynchophorus ferrugineus]